MSFIQGLCITDYIGTYIESFSLIEGARCPFRKVSLYFVIHIDSFTGSTASRENLSLL